MSTPRVSTPSNPGLPRVNSLLEVDVPGWGAALPTRVEDRTRSGLVIAAPVDPTERSGRLLHGLRLGLQWVDSQHGVVGVSGLLTEISTDRVPLWTIRIDSDPHIVRGRSHDRIDRSYEVVIEQVSRHPPTRFTARTLDIALGGFQCRTDEWAMVENGEEVRVRFGRHEPPALAAGVIVRSSRVRNVLTLAVSLRQPVPERAGRLLRQLVGETAPGDLVRRP